MIFRQVVEQLLDFVHIVFLKLEPRPLDALLKAPRSILHEVLAHRLELVQLLTRRLELLDKVGRREVQVDVCWRVDKEFVKLFTSPLNGVFDRIGEILDGARRNRLLGRVLRRRVGFRDEWNDNLRVGLGAERSGFEQRLLVKDTSTVHVLTCGGLRGLARACRLDRSDSRAATLSKALVTPSISAKKSSP